MTDPKLASRAVEVWAVKKKIFAAVAGVDREVRELALADAVALNIANQQGRTREATGELHRILMERHIENVLKLIPVNEDVLRKAAARKPH